MYIYIYICIYISIQIYVCIDTSIPLMSTSAVVEANKSAARKSSSEVSILSRAVL
jgi:hypothetical protein